MRITWLFVFATILLASCQREDIVFQEEHEIQGALWRSDDMASFTFSISDTSSVYRLDLDIMHLSGYAWENLYTRIHTAYPGDSLRQDILSLELANPIGQWLGRCRGEECTLRIPLQSRVKFDSPGDYTISFESYMRADPVDGISALGLQLVKLKE